MPLSVTPPPFAVVFVGLTTEPSSIFLSATFTVVEDTVVVVPLTVKLPVITTSLANVGLVSSTNLPVPVVAVIDVPNNFKVPPTSAPVNVGLILNTKDPVPVAPVDVIPLNVNPPVIVGLANVGDVL